jgi:hypothetical protein
MPLDPEMIEAMLRGIRATREEYAAHAEALREHGLEVDGFLGDCDEFIAVLEGRHEGEFDLKDFLRRVGEFQEEADEFVNIQKQVRDVEEACELHELLPEMGKIAAELRERGLPTESRTAEEIEDAMARIRAGLAEGRPDKDALLDIQLTGEAQLAEFQRRRHFREAACLLYWEKWPPERWTELSPKERKKLEDLLEQWRTEKERVLGALPLEDRRRLEAMRYEDFDKPGACDP